jgi:pantothenate kinase
MARQITLGWTETVTRQYDDVVLPLDRLVALAMEHNPDEFDGVMGEFLERAVHEVETFAPLLQAIAAEVGAEPEVTVDDINDVTHNESDDDE